MIYWCQECQIHAKKWQSMPLERQVSSSSLSQVLRADLMELNSWTALVTVDVYCGYITCSPIKGESMDLVIEALNYNFQKFGL